MIREVNSLAAVEAAAQETGAACGEINDVSAKLDELLYRLAKLKEMVRKAAQKEYLPGEHSRHFESVYPPKEIRDGEMLSSVCAILGWVAD